MNKLKQEIDNEYNNDINIPTTNNKELENIDRISQNIEEEIKPNKKTTKNRKGALKYFIKTVSLIVHKNNENKKKLETLKSKVKELEQKLQTLQENKKKISTYDEILKKKKIEETLKEIQSLKKEINRLNREFSKR